MKQIETIVWGATKEVATRMYYAAQVLANGVEISKPEKLPEASDPTTSHLDLCHIMPGVELVQLNPEDVVSYSVTEGPGELHYDAATVPGREPNESMIALIV